MSQEVDAVITQEQSQKKEAGMPPSGFGKKAVKGLLTFVEGNYEDLLAEVQSGKHPTVEAAIEYELSQLKKALEKLHINPEGDLVERP